MLQIVLPLLLTLLGLCVANYTSINLPDEHLDIYFASNVELAKRCHEDPNCPYKKHLDIKKCWGYEHRCAENEHYQKPNCPGDHRGWVQSKENQEGTFYTQADFGYVKQQVNEMKVMCEPMFPTDSSLECSEHMRFCRGRNLMLNFTSLRNREGPIRYKMDVLNVGDIGGYCNLYKDRLDEQLDHMSPLQSWAPEMRFFKQMPERPIVEKKCDVVIEKPTYIMKIDATVNMYHHFCDFINLYASQHLNAIDANAFSTDIHILIWESYTYRSSFEDTFKAFTRHPIWDLKTFRGETVCFKNVIFPLLPRMIFGLYYNTPIIYGCEGSGLFKSFSEHILHRLEVPEEKDRDERVRITFLSRDTRYRKVLNEDELIGAIKSNENYAVRRVVFNRDISFKEQLEIVRNTDVFISIHGAGLTHLLFMPDWGAVFELYNCEDANCYMDLTRLRGLKYITWENHDKMEQQDEGTHPEGGAHAKFTNYAFHVEEFSRLVKKAADHVMQHPKFLNYLNEASADCSTTGSFEAMDYDESLEYEYSEENRLEPSSNNYDVEVNKIVQRGNNKEIKGNVFNEVSEETLIETGGNNDLEENIIEQSSNNEDIMNSLEYKYLKDKIIEQSNNNDEMKEEIHEPSSQNEDIVENILEKSSQNDDVEENIFEKSSPNDDVEENILEKSSNNEDVEANIIKLSNINKAIKDNLEYEFLEANKVKGSNNNEEIKKIILEESYNNEDKEEYISEQCSHNEEMRIETIKANEHIEENKSEQNCNNKEIEENIINNNEGDELNVIHLMNNQDEDEIPINEQKVECDTCNMSENEKIENQVHEEL